MAPLELRAYQACSRGPVVESRKYGMPILAANSETIRQVAQYQQAVVDYQLRARFAIADECVGVRVAGQQRQLEEQQTDRPDRRGAAEPRQDNLGDDGLHLEQQEGAYQNG